MLTLKHISKNPKWNISKQTPRVLGKSHTSELREIHSRNTNVKRKKNKSTMKKQRQIPIKGHFTKILPKSVNVIKNKESLRNSEPEEATEYDNYM